MRVRNCIAAVALLTVAAVLAGAAAIESAQSAVTTDPAGDVKNKAEPWQDIVSGGVARQGKTFTFTMEMSSALPADPPAAPGGLGLYEWVWGVDTDPDLAPAGYPFPKTNAAPHDFLVVFASDGEDYFAFVIDRRPLVVGEEPIITPVPFEVDGASVNVFVDADLLDDPAAFMWRSGTINHHAHYGTAGFEPIDRAPDSEADWLPWPQS